MDRARRRIHRNIVYKPLLSQQKFHGLTTRFKGFSGPIGSGKSQALCHEAIKLSYLNPGRLGLLGAPTYPMLREATQAALFEILNTNQIPFEYNKAENTLVLKDTGSRILFRPLDEFERLRGTNLAWFGVDELTYVQEAAWLRLEGRLRDPKAKRLCGFGVWTPKGYDWVYRKFVVPERRSKEYGVVLATPKENRYLLKSVPDFYDRLEESYDENFYKQEVLGMYINLNGSLVYSSFSREQNISDLLVSQSVDLWWALDFNVDPMTSVIAQFINGKIHVVDEIVLRHATTQQACEEFLRRYANHRAPVNICGDASGYHEQTTGLSDYKIVMDYLKRNTNLSVRWKASHFNPPVKQRVNLTNSKLRSASGEVTLLVDSKCRELIQDFEQVCWKEDRAEIDKDKDRLRTHASDALGYLIWDRCRPDKYAAGEQARPLLHT